MKEKIMIVDDEPEIIDSLKTVLEKNNYDVITASSGNECLKELEKGFKGVILLDIMMPVMNGLDTIKEIVNRGYMKNVVIEIISAIGVRDNRRMGALEPYIYDYLEKPVDINELISSVKKGNAYLFARDNTSSIKQI